MSGDEIDPQVQETLERAFGGAAADLGADLAPVADGLSESSASSGISVNVTSDDSVVHLTVGVAERLRKRSVVRRARRGGAAALVACAAAVAAIAIWPRQDGRARIQTVDPAQSTEQPTTTAAQGGTNRGGQGAKTPLRALDPEDVNSTRWVVRSDNGDTSKRGTIESPDGLVDVIDLGETDVYVSSCPESDHTWSVAGGRLLLKRGSGPACALTGGFPIGTDTQVEVSTEDLESLTLVDGTRRVTLVKIANTGGWPLESRKDPRSLVGTWVLPGWPAENAANLLTIGELDSSPTGGRTEGTCLFGGGWTTTDVPKPTEGWSTDDGQAIKVDGFPGAACVGPPNPVANQVFNVLSKGAHVNLIEEVATVLTPVDRTVGAGIILTPNVPDREPAAAQPTFSVDQALAWTVAFVRSDDTLAVRSEPNGNSEVVARLAPGTTGIRVSESIRMDGSTAWRQVQTASGVEGWVAARFLVARPVDETTIDWENLQSITSQVGQWVNGGDGAGPAEWLAPMGLQVGGLLGYGDLPMEFQRIPSETLAMHESWTSDHTFEPPPGISADQCDENCVKPLAEALGFSTLSGTFSLRPHDIGNDPAVQYRNGDLDPGTIGLPSVTIDVPSTLESPMTWRRTHLFFDWSTGGPKVIGIYRWGWTP